MAIPFIRLPSVSRPALSTTIRRSISLPPDFYSSFNYSLFLFFFGAVVLLCVGVDVFFFLFHLTIVIDGELPGVLYPQHFHSELFSSSSLNQRSLVYVKWTSRNTYQERGNWSHGSTARHQAQVVHPIRTLRMDGTWHTIGDPRFTSTYLMTFPSGNRTSANSILSPRDRTGVESVRGT